MRHLEWFFEKMEESRPPLKLKNNGGLLSDIFSLESKVVHERTGVELPPQLGNFFLFHLNISFRETRET